MDSSDDVGRPTGQRGCCWVRWDGVITVCRRLLPLTVAALAASAVVVTAVQAGSLPADSPRAGDDSLPPTPAEFDDPEFQVDLALGLLSADELGAYLRWDAERGELAVQECMNNAGFDYVPMTDDDGTSLVDAVAPETADERGLWGFGLLPAMDPANYADDPTPELTLVDPNADVVAALGDDDQTFWYMLQAECRTVGMMRSTPLDNPDVYELVGAAHERIFSDPRVLAADAEWAACMAAAGQPFADRAEMTSVLADEAMLERFWQAQAWEPSSPENAEFLAAVERERAAAVADLECTAAVEAAAREVAAEERATLLAQWHTIDWSKPPMGMEIAPDGTADAAFDQV